MRAINGRSNIGEIESSRGLQLFGAILALLHLATFFFWRQAFLDRLRQPLDFLCWPFFPGCGAARAVPFEVWRTAFVFYGLLALLTALLFFLRRVGAAWRLLIGLTVMKFAFQAVDYRGMGNYHLMMSLAALVFLFVPDKVRTLRALMVLLYLASGILKFNVEWLTGAPLEGGPSFLDAWTLQILMAAVVVLEMIVAWWLLARSSWLRYGALASFVLFHLISWRWVGFYFPVVMLGLLTIYPLTWKECPSAGALESGSWPRAWSARAVLATFALLQIPPFFATADAALDARVRFLSLSMYDARPQCEQRIFLRYRGETVEDVPFFHPTARGQCNTLSFQSEMRRICAEETRRPDFLGADAVMVSKRLTDDVYATLLRAEDFCAKGER